jgi:hypothetical protein
MKKTGKKPSKEIVEVTEEQKAENFAAKYPHLQKTSKEWRAFYQELSRQLEG